MRIDFDVEHIYVGEALKQDGFTFHHRLARQRSDIAQTEYSRAVAEHGYQIASSRVFEDIVRVLLDLEAGLRNPRSVGKAQIALCATGLRRRDFDFPCTRPIVIIESLLFADEHDFLPNSVNRADAGPKQPLVV